MGDDLLSSVPLFSGFSGKEMKLLRAQLREDWFNAGDAIVTADDEGGRFYILTEGRANVIVGNDVIRTLGPGDYFGEMSLIDNSPRAATVKAETQVKTLWLGRVPFLDLLQDNWSMAKTVLADLCARIRSADRSSIHLQ